LLEFTSKGIKMVNGRVINDNLREK
jgi:hypothetical protein